MGDHSESIQVDFDPEKTSYERLLAEFWAAHDASYPASSRQYRSAILYHNEEQRRTALASKKAQERRRKKVMQTEIVPLDVFTLAEAYHQKYRLQNSEDLLQEYRVIYPSFTDFMNSTAVARVNGYLDGYGTAENLRKELPALGLSPEAGKKLLRIVSSKRAKPRSCPL